MCRLAIYMGPPLLMSKFVTEPTHSIIKQSYGATEQVVQMNGDGFGISWYAPTHSKQPASFREVTPAWSNENLQELARVTVSPCILAHVRKATSKVISTNCHPFTYKKYAFMHNGYIGHFTKLKKTIVGILSEEAYQSIGGSTDSEHLFALWIDFYKKIKSQYDKKNKVEAMADALCQVISTVEDLAADLAKKLSADDIKDNLFLLNMIVTDGNNLVATRFTNGPLVDAHTLFYCTGAKFHVHENGHTHVEKTSDVEIRKKEEYNEHERMVIVSSEILTPADDFKEVPVNYMVVATRDSIALKSIQKLKSNSQIES